MVTISVARERDLGLRLKRLREDAGWTQGQLSIQSGVPRGWISMVETRDAEGAPRADYVDSVARALGSNVHYLVTGQHDEVDPLPPPAVIDAELVVRLLTTPEWHEARAMIREKYNVVRVPSRYQRFSV